jgi:transcriptional regulator with XRE-family HTH domain
MSLVSENIKYLRKRTGLTQEQMAGKLGIKRSLLGAYEEGRADPRINNLIKFSEIFGLSVDSIINSDLTGMREPELMQRASPGEKLKVLAITVDPKGRENIELVPQRAAAGYLNGYSDPEYIEELPKFQLPMLPSNATYRAFEINGDSMLPLRDGTVVVGKYIENVQDLRPGRRYILVTQKEGVVFKRIGVEPDNMDNLVLISDNEAYEPYVIPVSEVLEIWEATAFVSTSYPEDRGEESFSLKKLTNIVLDLQKEVIQLKDRVQ